MAGYQYAPDRDVSTDDRAGIEAACRAYVTAWYTADEDLMRSCLHPDLDKRGMVRRLIDDRAEFFLPALTTASMMHQLTAAGVGRTPAEDRGCEITILTALHHLAAARVDLNGMTDLLHLMKFPEGWRITHSIWTLNGGVVANSSTDI